MFGGAVPKDQAVAEVYVQRMMKLQEKLAEIGFFEDRLCKDMVPQQFIDVGWGAADTETVCLFGNPLAHKEVVDKPNVIFESKDNVFYTILCFDADRVDCSETGCYLHWARRNVTGDIKFSSGRDTLRWQPPHPTGKKPHRFFIVVLHQSAGEVDLKTQPLVARNSKQHRSNFNLQKFMDDEGCKIVIGANCYRTAYSEKTVDPIIAALRDEIELDPTGRKIIAEVHDGVRKEF